MHLAHNQQVTSEGSVTVRNDKMNSRVFSLYGQSVCTRLCLLVTVVYLPLAESLSSSTSSVPRYLHHGTRHKDKMSRMAKHIHPIFMCNRHNGSFSSPRDVRQTSITIHRDTDQKRQMADTVCRTAVLYGYSYRWQQLQPIFPKPTVRSSRALVAVQQQTDGVKERRIVKSLLHRTHTPNNG